MATLVTKTVQILATNHFAANRILTCGVSNKTSPGQPASSPSKPAASPSKPAAAPAAAKMTQTETVDSTKYNTPEYYAHNEYSYYDIDANMKPSRLPQPSKLKPMPQAQK